MENKQKLRLPRLFWSSLSSCRPRNLSDVVENSIFTPETTTSFRMLDRPLLSSKARLFPPSTIIKKSETQPRPRVLEEEQCYSPLFHLSDERKTFCPPASPAFPATPSYNVDSDKDLKKMNKKKKKKKKRCRRRQRMQVGSDYLFSSSSLDGSCRTFKSSGSWCWSSSDDDDEKQKEEEEEEEEEDDETDTLFSSRSFSSDSSVFQHKKPCSIFRGTGTYATTKYHKTNGKKPICGKSKAETLEASADAGEEGIFPVSEGKGKVMKDSFAVVKKSSDPYEDFRVSMVEMIVERQIFASADLEKLLQCFLELNSRHHHRVIVEVFLEIYEALFSN